MRLKPIREQVVVVTGASSGIGLVTARRFAEAGAAVLLVARTEATLRDIVMDIRRRGGRAEYAVADMGDESAVQGVVETAVARFGGFDTWVNNAGVAIYARLDETPTAEHERMFRTNYWGAVFGSLAAVAHLKAHGGGALITVGSIAADMGTPILGAYAASKHAVKGFIDSLRIEILRDDAPISVTLIKPSGIDTPLAHHAANHVGAGLRIPPPVYAPDLVADAILDAAQHPRREVTVGGIGAAQTVFATHAPALFDSLAGYMEPLLSDPRRSPEPRDNLFEAEGGGRERSGIMWGRPFSLHATIRNRAPLLAGAGLVAGLALLASRRSGPRGGASPRLRSRGR
ncbi:SDR family oxidoreductase [uncultured Enterovirga sp.]|uniref:SDR family oxidoreductase n=1 Tax=uncultured Enterovirga sp. TaxID=2026352 RepID=UPI0035C9F43C